MTQKPKLTFLLFLLIAFTGCQTTSVPQSGLERVAKDWAMTIRAGQVFPIFPMEEDIRPGDVYLVDKSMKEEIQIWKEKGFLPLTNRYDRIHIDNSIYRKYYNQAFTDTDQATFHRKFLAAIPSYSFSSDTRGGLGVSIPISSVPVALSLSGAKSVNGTIVFSNVTSYGLPDRAVEQVTISWLKNNPEIKNTLKGKSIRVLTRVFAVKGINVSMSFGSGAGGNVQAGSPPETELLFGTSQKDYTKRIAEAQKTVSLLAELEGQEEATPLPVTATDAEKLTAELKEELNRIQILKAKSEIQALKNDIMRRASINNYGGYFLPGAKVSIVSRSERGISMQEQFERPLVIGYWAVQIDIRRNGSLIRKGAVQNLFSFDEMKQRAASKIADAPLETPQ